MFAILLLKLCVFWMVLYTLPLLGYLRGLNKVHRANKAPKLKNYLTTRVLILLGAFVLMFGETVYTLSLVKQVTKEQKTAVAPRQTQE